MLRLTRMTQFIVKRQAITNMQTHALSINNTKLMMRD